jgi:glutathione reductase (NADPH)
VTGAEYGISSDEFFLLKSRPQRVLVVGAGYIAVEMSQVKAAHSSRESGTITGKHLDALGLN